MCGGGPLDDAWAVLHAAHWMENDNLYTEVREVPSGRGALLDDVGRLLRAEIRVEVDPSVEASQDVRRSMLSRTSTSRMWVRGMEKVLESQRHRGIEARSKVMQTRASSSQAEHVAERSRQEAALVAANMPPPQPAPINALADRPHKPDPAKVWVVAAQVARRDAAKAVLVLCALYLSTCAYLFNPFSAAQVVCTKTALFS